MPARQSLTLACGGVHAYDGRDGASWVRRHEATSSLFTIVVSELSTLDGCHDHFFILIYAPNFQQKRHRRWRLYSRRDYCHGEHCRTPSRGTCSSARRIVVLGTAGEPGVYQFNLV